ncbi:hypothetical protein BGZ99_004530 [Dissophora globulifera]|uniref:N-acetyltransferase domain-containing protein n=1 Tax=Dissophora globulifera TaxID=979702 RepID=A0A9P6RHQ6_9FUNG|nr:hypothetical protein BGZ99_004530 [Dissophora globulifera]
MRLITISLAVAVSALLTVGLPGAEAGTCDPAQCIFPACVCPSVNPPNNLDPKTVPQFFTLTFDDAVQASTVPVAASLMTPHRNPNGCPIKSTWFAQTLYSDFSLIQQWYAAGNEVADHTMNHIGTPPADEVTGNRLAINAFSGIPFAKMSGFRAPLLNYSKSTFDILAQEKFLYDSSTSAVPGSAFWPYTLDYGLANDCWNGICNQTISTPGMWEIPMHAIMDSDLPTANAFVMDPQLSGTPDAVATWLKNNFNKHYQGTRQPFGIYLHPVHVGNSTGLYNDFFSWAAAQPDVWFVTNQQLLEWIKNPVPASQLADQPYMKCTLPAVGKEICNGLDDTKSGTIDNGVLQTCNFPSGFWSTCYGCPSTEPTTTTPIPPRIVAAGQTGYRTPVPANCAMEWWDPVGAQCLCNSSNFSEMSTSNITVRPATTSDVGAILSLIHELAKYEREPASTVEATETSLLNTIRFTPPHPTSQNLASCLLAFIPESKEPVAMALYFTNYSTWRGRGGIYLEDLYVKESVRGQRIGRRLLGELAREVVDMNGGRLEWAVLKWNEPSIQFYKSLGAVVMEEWQTMRVDGDALTKLAIEGPGINGKSTTLM